jgi:hypothetical protein
MFFLGERGGKRKCQGTVRRVGHWTTRAFKQPHFVIYYMLSIGGFSAVCLQVIVKGVLDPRLPWVGTCAVQSRQPVDLVQTLKTVKGLLLLVPSRTPRNSGYDVYAHVVYVVICYMSIIQTNTQSWRTIPVSCQRHVFLMIDPHGICPIIKPDRVDSVITFRHKFIIIIPHRSHTVRITNI